MPGRAKQILICIRLVEALREVLQGITSYMKTHHCHWQLQCVDADEFEQNLRHEGIAGAITVITPRLPKLLNRARRSHVPMVNMLHDVTPLLPSVVSDDVALGRAGGGYLIMRGFAHFGFIALDAEWSKRRLQGFLDGVGSARDSSAVSIIEFPLADYRWLDTGSRQKRLRSWVKSLRKPVAVMACSDLTARGLLTACEASGLKVPEEVAILGVDNLVATCELASVPLSSVAQNFPQLGFEAARLLDRLLSHRKPPREPVVVPPGPVAVRRSTDIFAFEDSLVANAMRLIHRRAADGMGVKELVNEMLVSRKWLDARFKAVVGRTPSQEIRRVKLSRVHDLLLNTELSIQRIAERCGFGSGENFIRFFRESEGIPPQQFRMRHRGQTSGSFHL
jgi:LacI family transcriptional regulator